MANAPDTSTYALVTADTVNLPQSRTLYGNANQYQLQFIDGGPGGNIEVRPTLTLLSLTQMNSPGYIAYNTNDTVTNRSFISTGTLNITNGNGVNGNTVLDVLDGTSIQKVAVSVNGSGSIGARSLINFISGTAVTINAVDNSGSNRIDVVIDATNPPDQGSLLYTSSLLNHSFDLGSLTSGLLKIAVSGGIATPSIAVANTDYLAPTTPLIQLSSCISTPGALIRGGAAGWEKLPAGTTNDVLTMQAGYASWKTPTAASTQLSTCNSVTGGLISGTVSGWQTLSPGTNGYVLTMVSGSAIWSAPSVSSTATFLCQTGTNLPPSGINLSAAGATLTVGTSSTGNVLHLENSPPTTQTILKAVSNNASVLFDINTYSGSPSSQGTNTLTFRSHRGTKGTPVAVAAGDVIFDIQSYGYYTAGYAQGASIRAQAEVNYTSTAAATALKVFTTDGNNVLQEHWKIAGSGGMFSTPTSLSSGSGIYTQTWSGANEVNGISQTIWPTASAAESKAIVSSIDNSGTGQGGGGIVLETFLGTSPLGPTIDFKTSTGTHSAPTPASAVNLGYINWYSNYSSLANNPLYGKCGSITMVCTSAVANPTGVMIFNSKSSFSSYDLTWYNGQLVVGSQTAPSTQQLQLTSTTGYNPASTTWVTTSDARIKKNIQDIENGLAIVEALQPRTFEFTEERVNHIKEIGNGECSFTSDDKFYGFIAQEVEKIVPEAVTDTGTNIGKIENVKDINVHVLNIILFKAVKELSEKVKTLESQISSLKP